MSKVNVPQLIYRWVVVCDHPFCRTPDGQVTRVDLMDPGAVELYHKDNPRKKIHLCPGCATKENIQWWQQRGYRLVNADA